MTELSLFGHRVAPVHSVWRLPVKRLQAAGLGGFFFVFCAPGSLPLPRKPYFRFLSSAAGLPRGRAQWFVHYKPAGLWIIRRGQSDARDRALPAR